MYRALSFRYVLPLLLVTSILFPAIRLPTGIPDVRLELGITLIAWVLLLLGHFATGFPIRFRRNPAYKWFFFFGFSIFLSINYAALSKGFYPVARDFFELAKLLGYFLIFSLVASLDVPQDAIKRLLRLSLIILVCSAFFSFAQFFNLASINQVISPYYAPTQIQGLLVHGRVTGTTANPNEFGALMVLAASLALSGALFSNQRLLRLFSWSCLIIFCLAIVLTLSRSALISLLVSVSSICVFKMPTIGMARNLRRLLIAAPVMIMLGLIVSHLAPEKFFTRIGQLQALSSAPSWQVRLINWQDNFQTWTYSPLFGWGPGKSEMTTIVDSEWLLLLRRYGIVGVIIFICWSLSLYLGLSKIYRYSSVDEIKVLAIAVQSTLLSYAVYMIPAAVYHSLQLMPILLLFLGMLYSQMGDVRQFVAIRV